MLCEHPLLQFPDFTRPFLVTIDASKYAIGGILSQGEIGKDLPLAYMSRLLNQAEQNYSTIEKELLSITDHRPLVWLNSVKDPTSRLIRWRLKLAEYKYDIIYKAGKRNVNADALSRNPTAPGKQILPIAGTSSSDDEMYTNCKKRRTEGLTNDITKETTNNTTNIPGNKDAMKSDDNNANNNTSSDEEL